MYIKSCCFHISNYENNSFFLFFMQHKSLIWSECHLSFVIYILYIGDETRCPYKFCRYSELCFMVAETTNNEELLIIHCSGVNKQLFVILHKRLILAIYHDWILFSAARDNSQQKNQRASYYFAKNSYFCRDS